MVSAVDNALTKLLTKQVLIGQMSPNFDDKSQTRAEILTNQEVSCDKCQRT
jgi:hypothetical protein